MKKKQAPGVRLLKNEQLKNKWQKEYRKTKRIFLTGMLKNFH